MNKYPGQSRESGGKAGALTGAALGAYAAHKGRDPKVFKLVGDLEKRHGVHKRLGNMISVGDKAKSWARGAAGVGKAFLPEIAAGALGAVLFARSRGESKEKKAVSTSWELDSKPGRSTITKQLSMLDGHRKQISESETGSVGSVIDRHKKVKQSIGDSMKLAFTLGDIGILGLAGAGTGAITAPKGKRLRGAAIGSVAGPVIGIGGANLAGRVLEKLANGDMLQYFIDNPDKLKAKQERDRKKKLAADLLPGGLADRKPTSQFNEKELGEGKTEELKEHTNNKQIATEIAKDHLVEDPKYYEKLQKMEKKKVAMMPTQPPADPEIQQKFRGRPPKMKDTTTVMGAMQDTQQMLAPASTTAGPSE